jgi:hypothetical protein
MRKTIKCLGKLDWDKRVKYSSYFLFNDILVSSCAIVWSAVETEDVVLVCGFNLHTVMNKKCLQNVISVTTV